MSPLPFECASAKAGQVGFRTRFIQKDQLGRIKARLPLAPEAACPRDIGTVLFAGPECLFLYVRPIFPNATWMACKEHCRPVASRNSLKVRSFFLASNDCIRLRWLATIIGLRPAK